jgi:hypothetical protein
MKLKILFCSAYYPSNAGGGETCSIPGVALVPADV